MHSIVALATTLNLSVTAEGIEAPDQQAQLSTLGCQMGQGYLFARPLPADSIGTLLRERTTYRHLVRAA